MFTFNADLEETLFKTNKVLNASTGRFITVNGAVYKKLIASGSKLISYVLTNDETLISEIEAYFAEQDDILFQQQLAAIAEQEVEEVVNEIAEDIINEVVNKVDALVVCQSCQSEVSSEFAKMVDAKECYSCRYMDRPFAISGRGDCTCCSGGYKCLYCLAGCKRTDKPSVGTSKYSTIEGVIFDKQYCEWLLSQPWITKNKHRSIWMLIVSTSDRHKSPDQRACSRIWHHESETLASTVDNALHRDNSCLPYEHPIAIS
jgi:hypothetical protein